MKKIAFLKHKPKTYKLDDATAITAWLEPAAKQLQKENDLNDNERDIIEGIFLVILKYENLRSEVQTNPATIKTPNFCRRVTETKQSAHITKVGEVITPSNSLGRTLQQNLGSELDNEKYCSDSEIVLSKKREQHYYIDMPNNLDIALLSTNPIVNYGENDLDGAAKEETLLNKILNKADKQIHVFCSVLTKNSLLHCLRNAQIVHISGHGVANNELYVEDGFGGVTVISGDDIQSALAQGPKVVKL
ncbi:hypothetical protein RFI_26508, partial [Reticulomyxa filosa]